MGEFKVTIKINEPPREIGPNTFDLVSRWRVEEYTLNELESGRPQGVGYWEVVPQLCAEIARLRGLIDGEEEGELPEAW